MTTLKIGQVAAQARVAVDTVRFYERRGVLRPASRRVSGYREFTAATVERIRFVKDLQAMGFSLDEVIEILHDVDAGTASCESERPRLEKVLRRLEGKITALQQLRRRLTTTLNRCRQGTCAVVETPRAPGTPRH